MADRITAHDLWFERLLDAPVATVWRWLVEPALRARWFMAGPTDLRVGGAFGLAMRHDNLSDAPVPTPDRYRDYIGHAWTETITRLEPERVLGIDWDGGDNGEVVFTLAPDAERTLLTLHHTGIADRAAAISFAGGWGSHLAVLERRIRDWARSA